jgi:membrane protease YdiL (CAAX protease family)
MENSKLKFRDKTGKLFGNAIFILLVIVVITLLTIYTGGGGYLFGIFIALITFWSKRWNWSYFGLSQPNWKKSITKGIMYAIGIFILFDIVLQPFFELIFGEIDLQNFEDLKGNLINYVLFIVFMWIVAGFGEEFLFRGYILKRLSVIFGDTNNAWWLAILISSIIFGLAHFYQGVTGVLTTGLIGFIFGIIFFKNKQNLTVAMFTHGFYDMIGITLIYLNEERTIIEFMKGLIVS